MSAALRPAIAVVRATEPRSVDGFIRAREVPPEWERLLREHSPILPVVSHLRLRWLPMLGKSRGEWRDYGRWMLDECRPAAVVPEGIRQMLEDRPPRLLDPRVQPGRRSFVEDWQHELYRTQGVYARPFWVIQGNRGGHPVGFTDREHEIAKARGWPTDPPKPGELPYAPFDGRVVARIGQRDRLRRMSVDELRRSGSEGAVQALLDEAQEAGRGAYLDWMEDTMQPGSDFLTWYTKRKESRQALRPARRSEIAAAARLKDEYVATGIVPV